jgi:hypothetical protein
MILNQYNPITTSLEKMPCLPILYKINAHPRDPYILFDEPTHKYTITTDPDSTYTSVTTWNHSHFEHFDPDSIIQKMMVGKNWNPSNKYYTMTPEQIKALWTENAASVSGAGTDMHYNIECFMNQPIPTTNYTHIDLYNHYLHENLQLPNHNLQLPNSTDPKEWTYFLKYVQAFPHFRPYRTEWMVYDEDVKISGSIDMVYENDDGTLSIYDWKRAKEIRKTSGFNKYAVNPIIDHIPDTNFWHYSLQLNTYKAILERKYGKQIRDLYLVRLHPNNPRETFDLIKCANLQDEVNALFEDRLTKMAT